MTIFVNGVPQSSTPTKPAFLGDNTNLFIGRWAADPNNGARLYNGLIADLRIYSVAISDSNIASLVNSSKPLKKKMCFFFVDLFMIFHLFQLCRFNSYIRAEISTFYIH